MRFFRIGDKVVSLEKLVDELSAILADREHGSTQLEAAHTHGVQRSFVSFLESLGEVRRGPKVALVAFPVANAEAVREAAEDRGLDFILVYSQAEREEIEGGNATEVFNTSLETLAALKDFDVVVLMASDWRIATVEKILGREVVGMELGPSPLRADVEVDLGVLAEVLDAVTAPAARPRKRRENARAAAGGVIRKAAGAARAGARGWTPSKKS